MEQTYQENLKLENTQEHLQTVLDNLAMANEELAIVLESLTKLKHEAVELEMINRNLNRDNSILSISVKSEAENNRKTALYLSDRKSSLDAYEEKLKSDLEESEQKLVTVNASIDAAQLEFDKISESHRQDMAKFETELGNIKYNIAQNEEIKQQKLSEQKDVENEITRLNSERETLTQELERARREGQAELAEATRRIEEEKDKIRKPFEYLQEETNTLNKRLRNLAVIEERLRKQYRTLNPDKPLPIELQETEEQNG
jgi:chromosome segregation ATPase